MATVDCRELSKGRGVEWRARGADRKLHGSSNDESGMESSGRIVVELYRGIWDPLRGIAF